MTLNFAFGESKLFAQSLIIDNGAPLSAVDQRLCVASFPNAPTRSDFTFIPLFAGNREVVNPRTIPPLAAASLPANDGIDNPLDKRVGLLVPLGDQLGDVGQYYSQVAPSIVTTILITNTAKITQSVGMKLYEDTGELVHDFVACPLAPQSLYAFTAREGLLNVTNRTEQVGVHSEPVPAQIFCASAESSSGGAVPEIRGIYHAQLTVENPALVDSTVINQQDRTHPAIQYVAESTYKPIPRSAITDTVVIPGVVVTRQPANWWDTEIVVANTNDSVVGLTFEFCNDVGHCFQNNQATLDSYERRSFLASYLAYEDINGFLEARSGWFSVVVSVTATLTDSPSAEIAVVSHLFRQSVQSEKRTPQAEEGSQCLITAAQDDGAVEQEFTQISSNPLLVRLFNPSERDNRISIQFFDAQGRQIASLTDTLGSRMSLRFSFGNDTSEITPFILENTARMRIQGEHRFASLVWQAGTIVPPHATTSANTELYIPFLGAPVVVFGENNDNLVGEVRQKTKFGLAETLPAAHSLRPEWARRLEWYNWSSNRESCNETVSDELPYSTYINTWWGLGRCSRSLTDRSCVNSEERLKRVKNTIPSNCTARPLFLANEPDLTPQGYMTYHELGRLMYLFRGWPGQVYSPTFASYRYDAPVYIPEPIEWCVGAAAAEKCPGSPLCAQCIEDGIVDGLSDPNDISFQGLEAYFRTPDLWAYGEAWPAESVIEGMNLHVYVSLPRFDTKNYWRAPFLQQYRDHAAELGWPINVKEYGIATWRDATGKPSDVSYCDVSHNLGDIRRQIVENLGNNSAQYNFNPQTLFWFHTGCQPDVLEDYNVLCLFDEPAQLSTPVGQCWYNDTLLSEAEQSQCQLACEANHLPLIFGQPK